MVLLSAVIYAGYILVAKPVIKRVGVQLYTGVTMLMCMVIILTYFGFDNGNFYSLLESNKVIGYGAIIGVFGTAIPILLLSYALTKTSASSYAVVSSIGPVATIVLATIYMGEMPNSVQLLGIILSIGGGFLASRQSSQKKLTRPLKLQAIKGR